MNKEELEKEAEEYVKQNYCEMCVMADDCKSGCIDCFTVQAYIASAEPREKYIAELEAQIEKMKRCEICKHYRWNHCSYEINISEDCIQNKLKHFELREINEK